MKTNFVTFLTNLAMAHDFELVFSNGVDAEDGGWMRCQKTRIDVCFESEVSWPGGNSVTGDIEAMAVALRKAHSIAEAIRAFRAAS